jgi:hypothetical protein
MSTQAQTQSPLLFFASVDSEGTYLAKTPKYSIYTKAKPWKN